MRAGASALTLLSVPLIVEVLQALEEEPRSLMDLRQATGSPPQTTMRGHLRSLASTGIVERRRHAAFPGPVDLELAKPGTELLRVVEIHQTWLDRAPRGPIELGEQASKSATKALLDGWSSALVRAIVTRPLSLTELSSVISGVSYPALERRLGAMRLAGLVERQPGRNGRTPYAPTQWLRQAVGPILAGMRWERENLGSASPLVKPIDMEAVFLLALPLAIIAEEHIGSCRFTAELPGADGRRFAGAVATARDGHVNECVAKLETDATAWSSGSPSAWIRALVDGDPDELEIGGDCALALALIEATHASLFRAATQALPIP